MEFSVESPTFCHVGQEFIAHLSLCSTRKSLLLENDCDLFSIQGKILVGTKDSEIIEITEKTASSQVGIFIYFCSFLFCFVFRPCLNLDKLSRVAEVCSLSKADFDPRSFFNTFQTWLWFQTILRGHGEGEIWGLACHPEREVFVTASDDKTVRLWDVASKVDKTFVMINTIGTIIRNL